MADSRNTIQKKIVYDTVTSMHNHPSAEMVYDKVAEDFQRISKATVYRILNNLADQGEIMRVRFSDGPDIYDFNNMEHYHIRCVKCGSVGDIAMPVIENIGGSVSDSGGYTVFGHMVQFYGICPRCKNKNS